MSTNTLTDRYVHEVVRRIPADQRDDVADELRTTIADTVDARDAADPDSAEREVLTEMGDPIRLAARYADRPLTLIGPELYPTYIRLLVTLLSIVLPVVTAALVVVDVLDNNDLGSAIGTGIGAALTVGAQMIAWLTVVFALVERSRNRKGASAASGTWTPDDLPELPRPDKRVGAAGAAAVGNALLIGLIVWQHIAEPYRADGNAERLQVLHPDLWSGWIWPILAGLAGLVALNLVRIAARGWTVRLAAWYALAEAAFALPLAWILYRRVFFSPEFLTDFSGKWTDSFYTVTALGVLVVSASAVVSRFREARG
ncbi:HAAS signaling domain-containing protein [Streptosporangium roseum]|uniref:HAAS signaling domain-containing protein n=1 Tax=Streptosporangium roseum TaxID=2001 RepID=UPI0033347CDC